MAIICHLVREFTQFINRKLALHTVTLKVKLSNKTGKAVGLAARAMNRNKDTKKRKNRYLLQVAAKKALKALVPSSWKIIKQNLTDLN